MSPKIIDTHYPRAYDGPHFETVKDLREYLEKLPDDLPLAFFAGEGGDEFYPSVQGRMALMDRWKNEIGLTVLEEAQRTLRGGFKPKRLGTERFSAFLIG